MVCLSKRFRRAVGTAAVSVLLAGGCGGADNGGAFESGGTSGADDGGGDESASASASAGEDGTTAGSGNEPDPSGDVPDPTGDPDSSGGSGDGDGDGTTGGPPPNPEDCGNGVLDPGETCDLQDFGGKSCTDFDAPSGSKFTAGFLTCNTVTCQIQTNSCTLCGDGFATGAEECDGVDLGFSDCQSEGFDSGELRCTDACVLDTTECSFCGDGEVNVGEECDGGPGTESCLSQGFAAGTLRCTSECLWDTSQCELCGDGVIGGGERCDCGADPALCDEVQLGRTSCTDLPAPGGGNFSGGPLACNATCDAYETSGCTICGDGVKDPDEACDGAELAGATCADAGFLPGFTGTVSCNADCTLDDSLCEGPRCGVALPAPNDGNGACETGWMDGPNGCSRTCTVGTCDMPIVCTPGRRCDLDCIGSSSCNNRAVQCAEGQNCDVLCGGSSACSNTTIFCPPDADCTVECDSTNACASATINCPTGDYACNVNCSGSGACLNTTLICGDGPCDMTCSGSSNACEGSTVACGADSCTTTCHGDTKPEVTCGESCGCVPC